MVRSFNTIWRQEDGQTTVEYAVIIVMVIGLAVASIAVLNPPIGGLFTVVIDRLTALA